MSLKTTAWLCLFMLASVGSHAATVEVLQLGGNVFSPRDVTVNVGDTVLWRNDDSRNHTTTSGPEGMPDGLFDSGNMAPGDQFSYTFNNEGTYPYYCDYHAGMVGTVTVAAAQGDVIKLTRGGATGNDVIVEWAGGPGDVQRGNMRDLSDLLTIGPGASSPYSDIAIVNDGVAHFYNVVVAGAPTLTELQNTVFTPECTGCHSGSFPPQGLDLSAGATWSNTVGVASMQDPARKRIEPGNPDSSYLVHKIEADPPDFGARMPRGGPYLSPAQIQAIRAWVAAGALDN